MLVFQKHQGTLRLWFVHIFFVFLWVRSHGEKICLQHSGNVPDAFNKWLFDFFCIVQNKGCLIFPYPACLVSPWEAQTGSPPLQCPDPPLSAGGATGKLGNHKTKGRVPKLKSAQVWSLTIEGGRGVAVSQNQILIQIWRKISNFKYSF